MMGHTLDMYHDIQSKGVEFLRALYANAGLHSTQGQLNAEGTVEGECKRLRPKP